MSMATSLFGKKSSVKETETPRKEAVDLAALRAEESEACEAHEATIRAEALSGSAFTQGRLDAARRALDEALRRIERDQKAAKVAALKGKLLAALDEATPHLEAVTRRAA